jgi:hypothetical protein
MVLPPPVRAPIVYRNDIHWLEFRTKNTWLTSSRYLSNALIILIRADSYFLWKGAAFGVMESLGVQYLYTVKSDVDDGLFFGFSLSNKCIWISKRILRSKQHTRFSLIFTFFYAEMRLRDQTM